MTQPAADVYEIMVQEAAAPTGLLRSALASLRRLVGLSAGEPAGMIVTVVRKADGRELFRHIEDWGHDEDHLRAGIEHDLATMTATEFASRWTD